MKLSGLLISVALAVLLAALVAGALSAGFFGFATQDRGCEVEAPEGNALSAARTVGDIERDGDTASQRITYTLAAPAAENMTARLCTTVGDVRIVRSADDAVRLVFDVSNTGSRSERFVEDTELTAVFASDAGTIVVAGSREPSPQRGWPFWQRAVHVSTTLEVPDSMRASVDANSDVGDVALVDVESGLVDLATDVGDVRVEPREPHDDITARVDVGKVTVLLPEGGAYDVTAQADVGKVDVDIGETSVLEREASGPGATVHARSAGSGATIDVEATSDVGDVSVLTG